MDIRQLHVDHHANSRWHLGYAIGALQVAAMLSILTVSVPLACAQGMITGAAAGPAALGAALFGAFAVAALLTAATAIEESRWHWERADSINVGWRPNRPNWICYYVCCPWQTR